MKYDASQEVEPGQSFARTIMVHMDFKNTLESNQLDVVSKST